MSDTAREQLMADYYGPDWKTYKPPLKCPHCEADLRDLSSGPPFKREIGITERDRVVECLCPDCGKKWKRGAT